MTASSYLSLTKKHSDYVCTHRNPNLLYSYNCQILLKAEHEVTSRIWYKCLCSILNINQANKSFFSLKSGNIYQRKKNYNKSPAKIDCNMLLHLWPAKKNLQQKLQWRYSCRDAVFSSFSRIVFMQPKVDKKLKGTFVTKLKSKHLLQKLRT